VPKRLEAGFQRRPVIRAIVSGRAGSYWFVRRDARIDFAWGDGSPDGAFVPDDFQLNWTGTLLAPVTGPLADITRAFDLMHAGESIRSVVTF
jgi:hypothetical protein